MKWLSNSESNELEYPDETPGSILARGAREQCNKLTRQEREELLRSGLASLNQSRIDFNKLFPY